MAYTRLIFFLLLVLLSCPRGYCAAAKAGTLRSWGVYVIPQFPSDLRLTAVAASPSHALGLSRAGTVVAWGQNLYGQCSVPTNLYDVVEIAAGEWHSLALRADGSVVGWGLRPQSAVPQSVTDVVQIAAGESHSIALRRDGTVLAWGTNRFGVLDVPPGLSAVKAIDARGHCNIALLTNRMVVTWGGPSALELTPPGGLSNVVQISAGYTHHIVLRADGTAVAWGSGLGASVPDGLTNLIKVSAGRTYNLALKSDGSVTGWGQGRLNWYEPDAGQVAPPGNLSDVTDLEAESYHSVALTSDGKLTTWGSLYIPGPGEVDGFKMVVQGAHVLALKTNGQVMAWGSNRSLQSFVPRGLTNVVSVDVGGHPTIEHDESQSVTLDVNGRVRAWGRLYYGGGVEPYGPSCPGTPSNLPSTDIAAGAFWAARVIGDGGVEVWGCDTSALVVPAGLPQVVEIDAGRRHGLALLEDGTVRSFGEGTAETMDVPAGLNGVVAVSAGWDYSLALRTDGTVVDWGRLWGGVLNPKPTTVTNVVAICAGLNTATALREDGSLVKWNERGVDLSESIPKDLGKVIAISAGNTVIVETQGHAGPALSADRKGSSVEIKWARTGTLYKMQRAKNVELNSSWEDVEEIPTENAEGYSMSVPLDGEEWFFRLIEL